MIYHALYESSLSNFPDGGGRQCCDCSGEVTVLKAQLRREPTPAAITVCHQISLPTVRSLQVIKLTQAGTDINVIKAFVANSASLFNLDADQIVALKDAGVPTDVINAMMAHEQGISTPPLLRRRSAISVPEPVPAPQTGAYAPDARANGLCSRAGQHCSQLCQRQPSHG